MSSAILYLAIIAIWACVLIPRWLRRDSSREDFAAAGDVVAAGDAAAAGQVPAFADAGLAEAADGPAAEWDRAAAAAAARSAAGIAASAGAGTGPAGQDDHPAAGLRQPELSPRPDDGHRARILAARRRMLITLLLLTTAAAGLVAVRLAAWWVTVPPGAMLAAYLMLLREARRADADRARLVAAARAREQARRRDVPAAEALTEQPRTAPVIDLTARVRDQVYDQYADPGQRAVGD